MNGVWRITPWPAAPACTLYAQGRLPGKIMTALNERGKLTVTLSEKDGKITDLYLEGPTEVLKTYEL